MLERYDGLSVCGTDKKIRLTHRIDNVTGNNNPHLCFRTIFFLCGSCMRLTVRVGLDLSYIVTSGSFDIDHQSHAAFRKHEHAVYNLLGSHYLIRGYREVFFWFVFFKAAVRILHPATLPRAALIFAWRSD